MIQPSLVFVRRVIGEQVAWRQLCVDLALKDVGDHAKEDNVQYISIDIMASQIMAHKCGAQAMSY